MSRGPFSYWGTFPYDIDDSTGPTKQTSQPPLSRPAHHHLVVDQHSSLSSSSALADSSPDWQRRLGEMTFGTAPSLSAIAPQLVQATTNAPAAQAFNIPSQPLTSALLQFSQAT